MAVSQSHDGGLADGELIEKAKNATNGQAFTLRFEREYESPGLSERYDTIRNAEIALLCNLAWWTNGDREQMWRIFQHAGLYRPRIENYPAYKQELLDEALEIVGDDGFGGADE